MSYCKSVENPWPLVCAGAGPLVDTVSDFASSNIGFVQPEQLPDLMAGATAFVLPSRIEPWGVVLHEAASSGLPLVTAPNSA